MSDLRPLLAEDLTEEERRLLRSARIDVPTRSGKLRTVAAMGLAAATAAGTSGASAATAGAGLMVKWMALGALGGTIALGAAGGLTPLVRGFERHPSPAVITHAPPAAPRAARPVLDALPLRTLSPDIAPTGRPDETEPPLAPSTPAAPTAPVVATGRREPPGHPADSPATRTLTPQQEPAVPPPVAVTTLAAEVGALDEARRTLASGDADGALRALDAYERRFSRRRLGTEATVLRIEVLLAQGRRPEAHRLGDDLLAAEPDGAYAQHVRSLLSGADR